MDDDLKRRGVGASELGGLRATAKFLPFLGLGWYLTARPAFPEGRGPCK